MYSRREFLLQTSTLATAAPIALQASHASAQARPNVRAAHKKGPRVKGVTRREETLLRLGGGADNFHMSWAADDRQYVAICDGSGWFERPVYQYNTRLFSMAGSPSNAVFEDVCGYPDIIRMTEADEARKACHYYGFGTLALDGRIYQFLSTRNHPTKYPDGTRRTGLQFNGAKLICSPDNGRIWCNQDGTTPVRFEGWDERSRHNMAFLDEPRGAFSLLSILQMGRNYEHNRDGYVYVYAPNGQTDGTMNELVMFRVPKDRILERASYEYFTGFDGSGAARWSEDIDSRRAVHTFPRGWVGPSEHPWSWIPSVAYNAGLGVYLMASWGTAHAADGEWFARPSYLGLWTAPDPWGPWTQIHEEKAWLPGDDARARAYAPVIAPKWIAEDGRSFWIVWSDFQTDESALPVLSRLRNMPYAERNPEWRERFILQFKKVLPNYGFNTQRVDLHVT